LTVEETVRFWW